MVHRNYAVDFLKEQEIQNGKSMNI